MDNNLPSNESLSNKEKIFRAAIDLFSSRGYAGVTLREIAQEVGIKASSIYNHYESKEAILDEIVTYFREQLQEKVYPYFKADGDKEVGDFIQSVITANDTFFSIPLHAKIGNIIFREQFQNEKIRSLLLEELIIRPRQVLSSYFEQLIRAGKMRPVDPVTAAKEYHAFYIYAFYENSLTRDFHEQSMERVQKERAEHVKLFLQTFCL